MTSLFVKENNVIYLTTNLILITAGSRRKNDDSVGESCAEDINAASNMAPATMAAREVATTAASVASNAAASNGGAHASVKPRQAKVTNNEKTLLLSSDDEFQ